MNTKHATLADVSAFTEDQAREYLEAVRWPSGPACIHCGSIRVTRLHGKTTRPGLLKCKDCRKPFTVMKGTIFEDSHIELRKWVIAFHLMCSSKKGISAVQLQRNLGLASYKSAWHMAHRIRHAMTAGDLSKPLSGTVEVDETYIGGKPRMGDGKIHRRGRGTHKTPVVALVSRDGRVRTRLMGSINSATLKDAIRENVSRDARIMTDELPAYRRAARGFAGGHHTVNHGTKEYARGTAHTNTAESFFSLMRRGVYGTFHHVSKEHLSRYCDEFAFRWAHSKVTDGERTKAAIRGAEGKRLTYL